MKRFTVIILTVLALSVLSGRATPATDIGELEPVSTVQIIVTHSGVRIRTDTGADGVGRDLPAAVEDLHNDAGARVFLETADYLLLTNVPEELTPRLLDYFRPSCRICTIRGTPDLTFAAQYLTIHQPPKTLNDLRVGLLQK